MHAIDVLGVRFGTGSSSCSSTASNAAISVETTPLQEASMWLEWFRRFWSRHLDALATELARGRRERRTQAPDDSNPPIKEDEE